MYRGIPCLLLAMTAAAASATEAPNPLIDYVGFREQVVRVGEIRENRRISQEDFLAMARDPDTVILDARSEAKYKLLHVKGARHLSLPDITEEELARVIPSKATRILIYCNNNFLNEPEAFPTKAIRASLNLYTMNVLRSYGYTNVYELGPLIDIANTKLEFEGSKVAQSSRAR